MDFFNHNSNFDLEAEVRKAQLQVDNGHYIRNEDIRKWLLSWGTKQELPPPKCICGKSHH